MHRPNILWIMTDQQRWDGLGVHGNPQIRTPHLDALAASGADLRGCFVQAPVCVPSRQTFFTGRYPHAHRNRVNYTPLKPDEPLLQRLLQDAGYATGFVGKLHYHPATRAHALATGFDRGWIHDAGPCDPHSDYVRWLEQVAPAYADCYRATLGSAVAGSGNPFQARIPERFHETTWTGASTRTMLAELAATGKPFFLFSSYWRPHAPFEVPAPWSGCYDDVEITLPDPMSLAEIEALPAPVRMMVRRVPDEYRTDRAELQWMYRSYYGAISQIDHQVGLTLAALDALGLREQTLVVFCSDHGDQLLAHGLQGKNVFFEESVRIPMLLALPGVVRPGIHEDLVESTDALPTIFELCGIPVPERVQGRSYAQLITGGARGSPYQPRPFVVAENIIPEVFTPGYQPDAPYAYVPGQGVAGIRHPDAKMIRDRRWKYCHYVGHGAELYDLQADPRERRNLASHRDCQPVVERLRLALLEWMITCDEREQIAPRWLPVSEAAEPLPR